MEENKVLADAKKFIGSNAEEVAAEKAIQKVIDEHLQSNTLKTVARVEAMIAAYVRVHFHFLNFIISEAEKLDRGALENNPFKEMAVSRLISQWLIDTEIYIDENELLLKKTTITTRQKYIEDTLREISEQARSEILIKLDEKRQELAVWLASEISKAKSNII